MLHNSKLRLVVSNCAVLHMRFDKELSDITSDRSSHEQDVSMLHPSRSEKRPQVVKYRTLPESMMPKNVSKTFTPFPLPKYDADLGYGPVRLRDIPDIAVAEARRASPSSVSVKKPSRVAVCTVNECSGSKSEWYEEEHQLYRRGDEMNANKIKSGKCIIEDEVESNTSESKLISVHDNTTNIVDTHANEVNIQDVKGDADFKSVNEINDDDDNYSDSNKLDGYRVYRNYPIIDRIECVRSVSDLMEQFITRTDEVARGMTLADMGAALHRCTNDEVVCMLNEISAPLTISGEGINFNTLLKKQFGIPYMNTSVVTNMYIHFINCLTETFVHEQPHRLQKSPKLFIQLLSFLALAKILEPNRWFSRSPTNLANRADYSHPIGINLTIAHKNTGVELYEYMQQIIVNDLYFENNGSDSRSNDISSKKSFLESCSKSELLDLLGGFAGVHLKSLPPGDVVQPILCCFMERFLYHINTSSSEAEPSANNNNNNKNIISTREDVVLLERAYFITQMLDVPNDYILKVLLGECESVKSIHFHVDYNALHTHLRERLQHYHHRFASICIGDHLNESFYHGPQFFAAVSRDRRVAVKMRALHLFEQSLNAAIRKATEEKHEEEHQEVMTSCKEAKDINSAQYKDCLEPTEYIKKEELPLPTETTNRSDAQLYLEALLESGTELLMSLQDKQFAFDFARQHDFDKYVLQCIPEMKTVAHRLESVPFQSDTELLSSSPTHKYVESSVNVGTITRIQERLNSANSFAISKSAEGNSDEDKLCTSPSRLRVGMRRGRECAIRTLLHNLSFVNGYSAVFLFHSSSLLCGVSELISAVRRVTSGKDGIIFTMSCLRTIYTNARYGATEQIRETSHRALNIIAYELEKGRATLLPTSEEILLHDAGVYCDEDLMLWSLAAYLTRELPLVKVLTVISKKHIAYCPYNTLRGEQTALKSDRDLHDKTKPLLNILQDGQIAEVVERARLQKPVLDRPRSLYHGTAFKSRLMYRRDKPLFDRFHVTGRHQAAGFSRAGLDSDTRGLGLYTPDHPQVPFRRNELYQYLRKHAQDKYNTLRMKV